MNYILEFQLLYLLFKGLGHGGPCRSWKVILIQFCGVVSLITRGWVAKLLLIQALIIWVRHLLTMNLRKFHFIKLLYLSRPVLLLVRKFCSVNFRLPGVIHSASNILHLLKGKLPIHVFSSRKIENKMVLYILFTTSELHVRYQKGDRSMREEVVVKALTDTLPLSNPAQNS